MSKRLKIYLSQINNAVGDLDGNFNKILQQYNSAVQGDCDLIIFCELTISSYPSKDLLLKKYFVEACQDKIIELSKLTLEKECAILIGCPTIEKIQQKQLTYNSYILIHKGKVEKIIHKKELPNYGVFDEMRYFEPAKFLSIIDFKGNKIALLICQDFWVDKNIYLLKEHRFDFCLVTSSSPFESYKQEKRIARAKLINKNLSKPIIYLNQIGSQDSLVFDGGSFVINSNSNKVLQMSSFAEDSAIIEFNGEFEVLSDYKAADIDAYNLKEKTTDCLDPLNYDFESCYLACILGLRDYMAKNGFSKVIIGMSGGVDSALVAMMAVDSLGSDNVEVYALPSRFNSEESMKDAIECAQNLDLDLKVKSIEPIFNEMLKTIDNPSQIAVENMQSRIRGNILMAISNSNGAILLSTGNKSELACGYATIYGDMCGGFNPVKDLYKTQIYNLSKWRNDNIPRIGLFKKKNVIPANIISKEPTAELKANQKDSDSLPDYEILDKILVSLIEGRKSIQELIDEGFDKNLVKKIAKIFYSSEYKRQQSVLGPKISTMSFDFDYRYPISNKFIK